MKRVYCLISKCLGCKSCEIACAVAHSGSRKVEAAVAEETRSRKRLHVEQAGRTPFPIQCRHCDEPACADACMSGAIRKDPETGQVTSDPTRCVGCWMCVMACPYGVITRSADRHNALKCDQCRELDEPACVSACPTGALYFCELEEFEKTVREEAARKIKSEIRMTKSE